MRLNTCRQLPELRWLHLRKQWTWCCLLESHWSKSLFCLMKTMGIKFWTVENYYILKFFFHTETFSFLSSSKFYSPDSTTCAIHLFGWNLINFHDYQGRAEFGILFFGIRKTEFGIPPGPDDYPSLCKRVQAFSRTGALQVDKTRLVTFFQRLPTAITAAVIHFQAWWNK